jgi:hypothetical protein
MTRPACPVRLLTVDSQPAAGQAHPGEEST